MGGAIRSTTFQRLAPVAALALAIFAAGCGSDPETPEPKTNAPQAEQPLRTAIAKLNRVIAEQDCDGFVALTYSALRVNAAGTAPAAAGEPVRPAECRENGAGAVLRKLKGTTFEKSKDYGAAAISQGPAGSPFAGYATWVAILAADRDGRWRYLSFYPADPQFGQGMQTEADPVATTRRLVTAMKTGDCSSPGEFLLGQTRLGETPPKACQTLAAGAIFTPAVRKADEVIVEEIGSTRDYSIVGVDTGETYFAVLLSTPPIKPGRAPQSEVFVNDIVPMTDFQVVEQPGQEE